MQKKVLIVEDDADIAQLVKMHLADLDCQISIASDGNLGLEKLESETFNLVILDLMLPGVDGLEICRRLRQQDNYTPVLMLTAKGTELDRVLGLEIGADDYLTKPFSVRELLARVKAIFRRVESLQQERGKPGQEQHAGALRFGELLIETNKRKVSVNGQTVELTAKEFDLLWHFSQHPGQVFTRNQLLDSVWGYGHDGYEHTVNSHINRLRAKIETDPSKPQYILTVWGIGYKFNDQHMSKLASA